MGSLPERIVVYGVTGSGKTTLARRLAERTGLPWHSVDDDLAWEPGWIAVADEEQRRRIARLVAEDRWVIDGMFAKWRDIAVPRAELIVALDYPRWVSLSRLVRRTVVRCVTRRPVCNGNVETLRGMFSGDSIIVWHFRSFARKRRTLRDWDADPGVPVVRLTSPRATRRWLDVAAAVETRIV
ncbi:AAA family ATPase [Amycolatopsis sp. cmx-11-32]|uniref:AAA family ATPase n=1 Tax=Amycolatopsis sp. cmx-11-32 TaxID=2785796 RepID=UPI0039E5AADF